MFATCETMFQTENFIQLLFLVSAEALTITDCPIKETAFAEES